MPWDWEAFYEHAEYDRCVYLAGEEMADLLARFVERRGPVADLAAVGCGPAPVLFDLAGRFPGVEFRGYDVSETVIADNRERAAEIENLDFAVDSLPDLATDRQFDVVYCVATLFFVAEPEQALRSLYDRVRPGGHLVVNYPNAALQAEAKGFEDRKSEAFELVVDGENLLTADDVEHVLDADTEDYWSVVDAEDVAEDRWPIAVVGKPDGE